MKSSECIAALKTVKSARSNVQVQSAGVTYPLLPLGELMLHRSPSLRTLLAYPRLTSPATFPNRSPAAQASATYPASGLPPRNRTNVGTCKNAIPIECRWIDLDSDALRADQLVHPRHRRLHRPLVQSPQHQRCAGLGRLPLQRRLRHPQADEDQQAGTARSHRRRRAAAGHRCGVSGGSAPGPVLPRWACDVFAGPVRCRPA